MSHYFGFVKGVPEHIRNYVDYEEFTDDSELEDVGITELGMFDPDAARWSMDYETKTRFDVWLWDKIGREMWIVCPTGDGNFQSVATVVETIPILLEKLPAAIQMVERLPESDRDKDFMLYFLKTLDASLRQVLKEAPDGRGYAILTV